MARVLEQYIVAAIVDRAESEVANTYFYPEEDDADSLDALTRWCMVAVSFDEDETRKDDYIMSGTMSFYISARDSLNDYHAARKIAQSLQEAFKPGQPADVTDTVPATVGYLKCEEGVSRSLGKAKGVYGHFFSCDFKVYSA